MSEYQYYEFQAIDRPLTEEEQQAVAQLSSRVDPHPRRAVFTYSYSDFPGRAGEVLAKYYDALLYLANWGSRQLMFRFPKALVDVEQIQQFSLTLNKRLSVLTGPSAAPDDMLPRRTVGELLAAVTAMSERRRREQVAKAEARRIAELEALAQREDENWREVDALI